jgi:nicotinamidase-related amidase
LPKTLLDHAGATRPPADWSEAVLVLIDPQREYLDGKLPLDGIDAAIEQAALLLAAARRLGAPVVHVLHHAKPGAALFNPDDSGAASIPRLAPIAGESIVIKGLPNGFAGTELAAMLAASGRTALILAGFATHMCVSATTRAALDHGFRTTVVAAACADRDLPNPLGGDVIPAAALHQATLAALADRFAVVVADAAALGA